MKTIKLIDMTLREVNALKGGALTFKEKLEIARTLDRLKADAIELAPIAGGKADQLANKTIAATVSATLSAHSLRGEMSQMEAYAKRKRTKKISCACMP